MMSEDAILDFAASLFRSVWALELLLAFRHRSDRSWKSSDIIKELRGSRVVVTEAVGDLVAAGLVVVDDDGGYRYHAGPQGMDEMVGELEKLYALKPTAVVRSIITSPSAKLQILSDAFRIKE